MRILVLNYEFPPLGGGASPVSYEIAKGYARLGHEVTVVTAGFKGLPRSEKVDGINVHRVPCLRSKKEICQPHEMLSYVISAKRFLRKHLKTHSYDVNHSHSGSWSYSSCAQFLAPSSLRSSCFLGSLENPLEIEKLVSN